MQSVVVSPAKSFRLKTDEIAPDKSISHRSVMFAMLADGVSEVRNFLLFACRRYTQLSKDCAKSWCKGRR